MAIRSRAQYFTVRNEAFKSCVARWIRVGVVAPWTGRIVSILGGVCTWKEDSSQRFVGVPGMNAVGTHLAEGLDVRYQSHVDAVDREGAGWRLCDRTGKPLGTFDCLVVATPAPQAAALLSAAPNLEQQARQARMTGCWAVMLGFAQSLSLPFDGAFIAGSPLAWVARDSSKPSRSTPHETWVLHASPEWSEEHIEETPDAVLAELTGAFWSATGATAAAPSYAASHRWRYALPPEPLASPYLYDAQLRIGACGDWCGGPRVEGAFLSGQSLASRILAEHQ